MARQAWSLPPKRGPCVVGQLVGVPLEQDDRREEEVGRGWEAQEKKRKEAGNPRGVRHRERNPIIHHPIHGLDVGLVIACSTRSQALEACDWGFRGLGGSHWRPNPTMGCFLCVLEAFASSASAGVCWAGGRDSYYS